jgi:hypothetical protein
MREHAGDAIGPLVGIAVPRPRNFGCARWHTSTRCFKAPLVSASWTRCALRLTDQRLTSTSTPPVWSDATATESAIRVAKTLTNKAVFETLSATAFRPVPHYGALRPTTHEQRHRDFEGLWQKL